MYNVHGLDGWDAIYLTTQRWMLKTYITYELMLFPITYLLKLSFDRS